MAIGIGLGPTLLGVGAIGVVFCVPVAWKVLRALHTPRIRTANPEAPEPDDALFDADAALARYLARKSAGTEDGAAPPHPGAPELRPEGHLIARRTDRRKHAAIRRSANCLVN